MEMEKLVLALIKKTKPKLKNVGIRGLVKTGENEWSFRYVYQDGDYLTLSKSFKAKLDEYQKEALFVRAKRKTLSKKQTVKK